MSAEGAGTPKSRKAKDPDFPVVRQHLRDHGLSIAGSAPKSVFPPVPWRLLEKSVLQDIKFISKTAKKYPVYAVLNLLRNVYSLQTRDVSISKKEAGEYGLRHFPEKFHPLIRAALDSYKGSLTPARKKLLSAGIPEFIKYCSQFSKN